MVRHASLRLRSCMLMFCGLVSCLLAAHAGTAVAQTCGVPFGSFGNAGFAAGYGMQVGRGVFIGCGPVQPRGCAPLVCRPNPGCWNPCWPNAAWRNSCWPTVCRPTPWVCGPAYGWGGWGWPGGWYGTSWYSTVGSVSLAAPFGGGTFFSGGVVPLPSVARSKPAPVSNAATRQRAARLVAAGDRHLAAAAGDAARLRAALDAYRRAAAIARDEPDTFIRQALALEALGQAAAADKPLAQAVALDGRLAAAGAGSRPDAPPDPAFGARAAGEPAPLALRGQAILQQIAAAAPGDDRDGRAAEAIAWLAERWSGRWQGEPATAIVRR